jgi:asparagine synthase (glutamine-hydrolysing)
MCGILTWLSRTRPIDGERLKAGLLALRHRGPDALGITALDVPTQRSGLVSVGLAHARLAILDPLPRANQPFRHGDHVICYNGEIYNHHQLAGRLHLSSRSTVGDTEVLLSLLTRAGLNGLAEVGGMWAFTWLDIERRRLVAARDRYGKKPLFYVAGPTDIVLASEISALRAVLGASFALRDEALATFLSGGWLLPKTDGTTHLQNVREVRAGHALTIDLDAWTLDEVSIDGLW